MNEQTITVEGDKYTLVKSESMDSAMLIYADGDDTVLGALYGVGATPDGATLWLHGYRRGHRAGTASGRIELSNQLKRLLGIPA